MEQGDTIYYDGADCLVEWISDCREYISLKRLSDGYLIGTHISLILDQSWRALPFERPSGMLMRLQAS